VVANATTHNARSVVVNAAVVRLGPGPNPTIESYNASVVKIYTSMSSLVRFENKNIFSSTL
jgi:hypothetical protein